MKKITVFISTLVGILAFQLVSAHTVELQRCDQLKKPKTVLLVHASWCSHCQHFLPTYENVSNRKDMSQYTFYTKDDERSSAVCGVAISAVPMTFTHNMKGELVGEVSEQSLVEFVKDQA